jgi:uncharacterized protein YqeY
MIELMEQLKESLKNAMMVEICIRKNPHDDDKPSTSQQFALDVAVVKKNVARAILSMLPEIGKKPSNASDDDLLKTIKKYINQQKERQLYIQKHLTEVDVKDAAPQHMKKLVSNKLQELGDVLTSPEIAFAQTFLPKKATEEEVIDWIKSNLDLSTFKNKMQAMGPILKQFKGCDGNFIKSILMKI